MPETPGPSLFDQLCGVRDQRVPVVIRLARFTQDPAGRTVPVPVDESPAFKFEIRSISGDELAAADAVYDRVKPREKYQERPNMNGPGMIREVIGWDDQHPDYIAERQALSPLRQAMVCLAGCPDLMGSTPGANIDEKAKTLTQRIPAVLLDMLTREIENLAAVAAVGAEDVEAFFRNGYGQSQKQPAGKSRRQGGGKQKP